MDEEELDRCINRMGEEAQRRYLGCRCIDRIPDVMKPGQFVIVNTLTSNETDGKHGQTNGHWTVLFYGENCRGEGSMCFFDSFGNLPQNMNFVRKCLKFVEYISYNNICLQNIFSNSCPKHVIFVIYHWLQGLSISSILTTKYDVFTEESTKNDKIVETFFNDFFS